MKAVKGDCAFCDIAFGFVPQPREFQIRDTVMIFEPKNPHVPGHRLIVPKMHTESLVTAGQETVGEVMWAAGTEVARWMTHDGGDGANVLTSVGEAATQSVMHWHVHVVPRTQGDELGRWPWV